MRFSTLIRPAALPACVLALAAFVGGAFTQPVRPRPGGVRPGLGPAAAVRKAAVRKIELTAADVTLENGKGPVPFKRFDLAELGQQAGKALTPEAPVTLMNQTVPAGQLLQLLNTIEEKLSAKGYSLRATGPASELKMTLKRKADPNVLARQRAQLAGLHRKVAPDKDQRARAELTRLTTKGGIAQLATQARANDARVRQWRANDLNQLKALDTSGFDPAEKNLHARLLDLAGEPSGRTGRSFRSNRPGPGDRNDGDLNSLLRAPGLRNGALLAGARRWLTPRTSEWSSPPSWNWSAGDPGLIEAHFRSKLSVNATHSPLLGGSQRTHLDAQFGGYVLNNELTFFELNADFQTASPRRASAGAGNRVQLSAKLGNKNLFDPIDQTGATTFGPFEANDHDDVEILTIKVNLLRLLGVETNELGGLPGAIARIFDIEATLHVKLDANFRASAVLDPSGLSASATVRLRCEGYGAVGFGDLNGGPAARLRGTVTLIDDTLTVGGAAGVRWSSQNPELAIDYSVHDRLALGGGELNLDWSLFRIWRLHPHGTVTLRWQDVTAYDGYLAGPDTVRVPLQ